MKPNEKMDLSKFYAEGTADYLKTKIKKSERLLKINQYLSFALPLLVGGYAAVDHSSTYFELLVWATGILSIIVLLSNLYTLVMKTDENLSRYLESYSFNKLLTDLYGELSSMFKSKAVNQEPAKHLFLLIKSKDDFNAKEDEKYVSNDKKNESCSIFLLKRIKNA